MAGQSMVRTDWGADDSFKKVVTDWFNNTSRPENIECDALFKKNPSWVTHDKFERRGRWAGMGLGQQIEEGQSVPLKTPKYDGTKDWEKRIFALGYRITHKMKFYNEMNLVKELTQNLKLNQHEAIDIDHFNLINNPTSTTEDWYKGFDDLALASNSHECLDDSSTTYDNLGSAAFGLAALESAIYYYRTLVDDQGQKVGATKPDTLFFEATLEPAVTQVLKTSNGLWSAEGTINFFKGMMKPELLTRITSTTMWGAVAKNNPKYDLFSIVDMEPDIKIYGELDTTRDTVVTSYGLHAYGYGDPRYFYLGNT